MKLLKIWSWLLYPPKFYGGGGGTKSFNMPNPQQEALANVADHKWAYYKEKYVPLEDQWMKQVGDMDNQGNHNDAVGMSVNTMKQNQGPQTQSVGNAMDGQRLGNGSYYGAASSNANAAANADIGVTNRMLQGEQGIVAMGTGQSAGAIQGLGSIAEQSVDQQNQNARNAFDSQQSTNGIYGTGAGMASAAIINSVGR